MEIIIGKQGNQPLPITDPTVSRKHCKVIPNGDGTYTLENLSANGTMVDGRQIVVNRSVKPDSELRLGPSYTTTLRKLLALDAAPRAGRVGTNQHQQEQREERWVSIAQLKNVWDEYEATNIEMANKQRSINLTRTGFGIFTMCVMPTMFFLGPIAYVLTGIGVAGNIYSFVGMKNAETAEEKTLREREFERRYVCPGCGKNFPKMNYDYVARNYDRCPHCKVGYRK